MLFCFCKVILDVPPSASVCFFHNNSIAKFPITTSSGFFNLYIYTNQYISMSLKWSVFRKYWKNEVIQYVEKEMEFVA